MPTIHRYLLNHLSAGEFIILVIVTVMVSACIIVFLSRKYFSYLINEDNTRYIGFFLGSITANYAFILGFIIVTLWQKIGQVDILVIEESEALSTMVHTALAFPTAIQNEMMNGIGQYIKALVQNEWPSMRLGYSSPLADSALTNLFHLIQSYSPDTKVESTFYNQFVSALNKVSEYRGKRLQYLHSALIDVIRFMLGFGLVLIIFLLSLLKSKNKNLQLVAILLVSSMLSFNLGLALVFDYPLAGSVAVSSEPLTNGTLSPFHPLINGSP